MQKRNRLTDRENKLVVAKEERKVGRDTPQVWKCLAKWLETQGKMGKKGAWYPRPYLIFNYTKDFLHISTTMWSPGKGS